MGKVYKNKRLVHTECDRCGGKAPGFMDTSKWRDLQYPHGEKNVMVRGIYCPQCSFLFSEETVLPCGTRIKIEPDGTILVAPVRPVERVKFDLKMVSLVSEDQLVDKHCRINQVFDKDGNEIK